MCRSPSGTAGTPKPRVALSHTTTAPPEGFPPFQLPRSAGTSQLPSHPGMEGSFLPKILLKAATGYNKVTTTDTSDSFTVLSTYVESFQGLVKTDEFTTFNIISIS